jgi:hypothetical protein
VDVDSVQLMLGYGIGQPLYYIGFVIIIFQFVQVFVVQWSGAAQDISERITFDSVNLAVRMSPKSFYSIHNTFPC